MKTVTHYSKSRATSTEAVRFSDGMLVTAEDLTAAGRYPLDVLQVLVRSYFGCGIVCGLKVGRPPASGNSSANGTGTNANCPPDTASFVIQVDRGVALDCHGFPLELCAPLKLDLTPDPCSCDDPPTELCIAIRHVTSDSAPKASCGCSTPSDHAQCSRVRDHVEVAAFPCEDLPENTCKAAPKNPDDTAPSLCDCLKDCAGERCCGESWVLIGRVTLNVDGVVATFEDGRQYVKPVRCAFDSAPAAQPPDPEEAKAVRANMEMVSAEVRRHTEEIANLLQLVVAMQRDPAVPVANPPVSSAPPASPEPVVVETPPLPDDVGAPSPGAGEPPRTPRPPRRPG